MKQLYINYTNGYGNKAYPDNKCEQEIMFAYDRVYGTEQTIQINTSTINIIHCVRALCKRGNIDPDAVVFMCNGETIETIVNDGVPAPKDWNQLPDYETKWLNEAMGI